MLIDALLVAFFTGVVVVLLLAFSAKVVQPDALPGTLQDLAFSTHGSYMLAGLVISAELGLAATLSTVAGIVPSAISLLLGSMFLMAGVLAIRSKTEIKCACFGNRSPLGSATLGFKQIAMFPFWLVLAWVLMLPRIQTWSYELRLLPIILGMCGLCVVLLIQLRRGFIESKLLRTSLG